MNGKGVDNGLEGAEPRDQAAYRNDRLAVLERSHQRLQHLYDISRVAGPRDYLLLYGAHRAGGVELSQRGAITNQRVLTGAKYSLRPSK